MRSLCALALIATALGAGNPCQLHSQQPVDAAPLGEPHQALRQLGDLRLKTYSIHGYAPLVVLLTTAPGSVPPAVRNIRHFLTEFLMRGLDETGVSLLSVRAGSDSVAFDALRMLPPGNQPQIVIAFGERAAAVAHVLARDSLPAALVALAPGASVPTAELSQTLDPRPSTLFGGSQ